MKFNLLKLSLLFRFIDAELKELLQSGQLQIGKVQNEAVEMSKSIGFTASLADGVSAKVKQLDLAKIRVSECQQRVNDLIDLRQVLLSIVKFISELLI